MSRNASKEIQYHVRVPELLVCRRNAPNRRSLLNYLEEHAAAVMQVGRHFDRIACVSINETRLLLLLFKMRPMHEVNNDNKPG